MSELALLICRSASDYLKQGYVTGYCCAQCQLELQVSPTGQQQIAQRGSKVLILCNTCGFKYLEENKCVYDVMIAPGARQTLDEWERESKGGKA